jgi:DNA-directed RNA polymerase specialized sigma24 family protein
MSPSNLDALYQIYWDSPRSRPSPDGLIAGVRSYALKLTRDEDVAQNVSVIVLAKLESFRRVDSTAFSRWVKAIVRRTGLEAYRTSSDHTREFDENACINSDDSGYVNTSELPETIRLVADKLLQGYSLTEIASQLSVTPAALRNRLSRYRKAALRNAA